MAFSDTDAGTLENTGEEEAPRDTEALYASTIETASDTLIELNEDGYADHEKRSLSYGDESVLILQNTDFGFSDSVSQRVSLIVREGDVVSRLSFSLGSDTDKIDLTEAERLLTEAADDVFG